MPNVTTGVGTLRRVVAACVCAAALGTASPALGQRDTTARDTLDRPFVRGGVYDKPYLARLGGRTTIGGYAEAHARWERVDGQRDEAGFEAKRFNLFTNARVSDFVRIGAELEFEDGGEEVKLEYAAIDLRIHPSVTLRGGMLLSPFCSLLVIPVFARLATPDVPGTATPRHPVPPKYFCVGPQQRLVAAQLKSPLRAHAGDNGSRYW